MSYQNSIETIILVDQFLAICRGYVEEAIAGAFTDLKLESLLITQKETLEIANELEANPNYLGRFLNAAATIGLVSLNDKNQWIVTNAANKVFVWKEIHNVFLTNETLMESNLSQEATDILIKIGILQVIENGIVLNQEVESYFNSKSLNYLGPLINSYNLNSVPFITKGALVAILQNKVLDQKTKPFSAAGWSDESIETFMLAMHFTSIEESCHLIKKLPLNTSRYTVLDVGGGLGTCSAGFQQLLTPPIKRVIYDRSSSIPVFKKLNKLHDPNNQDTTHYVGGDFLKPNLHKGLSGLDINEHFDIITLGWILHDWSDEDCIQILSKVVKHLSTNGRLCIFECVLPESKLGSASLLDITMLIQTEGRERTLAEYTSFASQFSLDLELLVDVNSRRQMLVFRRGDG